MCKIFKEEWLCAEANEHSKNHIVQTLKENHDKYERKKEIKQDHANEVNCKMGL